MAKVKAEVGNWSSASAAHAIEAQMPNVTADAVYGEEASSLRLTEETSDHANICFQHFTLMGRALKFRNSVLMNLTAPEGKRT